MKYGITINQLHEILTKFSGSHDIVIGGDFQECILTGSHRTKCCPRDSLPMSLHREHNLTLHTFFHTSGDSSSEIDDFFLTQYSELDEVASIEDIY